MSRIQHILDKAEREGAAQRMRVVVESPATLAIGAAADPIAPPPVVETAPPVASPGRTVTALRLDRRLVAAGPANSAAAEQYRALRTRIMNADTSAPVNAVLVTSPCDGDGKTLTVANLGLVLAQEFQRRVCVVDANMRRPRLHALFGLADGPGLSDILVGRATIDEACVSLEDHHLALLPGGSVPRHPAELLGTITMRRTIEQLRSRFDSIVIDAPAALPLADVGVLVRLVDGIVVVVRAGTTPKPAIHDTVSALDPGKVLGLVLNDAV